MSIQALAWVVEECDATLGARCLMIAIANHADELGGNCWASVRTLARESRISRQAVQKNLRKLEEEGVIESTGTHRRGTTIYRIVGMGGPSNAAPVEEGPTSKPEGAKLRAVGGQPELDGAGVEGWPEPEPSIEPSEEPGAASAALRLCRWLSEAAGEDPRPVYSGTQIEGAQWLLDNVDHAELRDVVTWALTRTYWAPRVRTAGRLRREWNDLRVEWRAGRNGRQGGEHPASRRIRERMGESRPTASGGFSA